MKAQNKQLGSSGKPTLGLWRAHAHQNRGSPQNAFLVLCLCREIQFLQRCGFGCLGAGYHAKPWLGRLLANRMPNLKMGGMLLLFVRCEKVGMAPLIMASV